VGAQAVPRADDVEAVGAVARDARGDRLQAAGHRAEIAEIRGVSSSSGVLQTLIERKLIKTVGRKQVVGRPFMYGTTREFLERFGLNDISDLPKVEELSDALGFELPAGLAEPTVTTSPLPFETVRCRREPRSSPPSDRDATEPDVPRCACGRFRAHPRLARGASTRPECALRRPMRARRLLRSAILLHRAWWRPASAGSAPRCAAAAGASRGPRSAPRCVGEFLLVSSRQCRRHVGSSSGPMRTRSSRTTGGPTASNILPTCRCRPFVDRDLDDRLLAACLRRRLRRAHLRRRGAPALDRDAARQAIERARRARLRTRASYTLSTSWRGCVRRAASSPSLVQEQQPSVS
jgi:hypothetical protein